MTASDTNITSIFNAVEFIENNLQEEITIADVADAVFYSLYHFCRMFNGVIHHTPYDYLMRRRLSESARDLINTEKKIIEIAFDYQFNSPETYARAFKRMFETQPNQWRKQGELPERALMPRLTLAHLRHINKGKYLKPVLEEKEAFRLAGLMTLVKDDKERVISQLWEMLIRELEDMSSIFNYYGITWYPKDWQNQGVFYMAGVKIPSPDITIPALVVKTIPSSQYARFIHKGPRKNLHLTMDYIYHTWLPKSDKTLSYPLEIESYAQEFRSPDREDSESVVYIPII